MLECRKLIENSEQKGGRVCDCGAANAVGAESAALGIPDIWDAEIASLFE